MRSRTWNDRHLQRALNDIGQVILNSTKVGYMRRISPDGKAWASNPPWYAELKRGAAPLTGPINKSVGGRLAGKYEFAHINTARMKNTLFRKIHLRQGSVEVTYPSSVQPRAKLNQVGGSSVLQLTSVKSGKPIEFNVKVQARPHLGIADKYARMGGKTDVAHIDEIINNMVGKKIV